MLRKAHSLIGMKIHAVDGELGHVDDFYFDDEEWIVRYMIIRTGPWFMGEQVMVTPSVIHAVEWEEGALYLELTQDQIKNSPSLDLAKPVTREQEMELASYYQWPQYWADVPTRTIGSYLLHSDNPNTIRSNPDLVSTDIPNPRLSDSDIANMAETKTEAELRRAAQAQGIPHLRAIKEVTGYHIAATDGEIGHVEDFFMDENSWQIQYLLVDTSNWLGGRHVLISLDWITGVSWTESEVSVNVTRDQVKNSPEYDPKGGVDRHYEGRLYSHYGSPPYWV